MVLNLLRKRKIVKRIMWIIAILIVPAFIFWGVGSAVRSKSNIRFAGTIFGKRISLRDYTQSLRACRNQAKLIYGDKFSEVAEYLNLPQQAWARLILLYQAKRGKISVKDEEVINWIKNSPLFQEDGKFDRTRYNLILQHLLRVEPRKFEEEVRDSLKIAKLRERVVREVAVTEDEVKEAYRRKHEKREVSYILIESKDFKEKLTLTEEELKAYYKDNREEFRLPEQVNVEYLNLAFDKFKEQVLISDEDIKDYYNTHLTEFIIPSQEAKEENKEPKYKPLSEVKDNIKSNLIFQEAKHKAQMKASQILEDLVDEPDFEKIAQEYAISFGETGFFAPQEGIPGVGFSYQFVKEAFSLTRDEISDIITTPKGLYIIRLKEKKASFIPSFEEAKTKIEEAVRRIKAKELAREKAEEILLSLKESNFEDMAKELSLTIKKSEPFTKEGYIPGIGEAPEFSRAAFNLKVGQISKAVSTPKGYSIFRLDNIHQIDKERFLEEKEEFKKTLLEEKKEQYFQNWFLKLKRKANLSSNLGES